MSSPWQLQLKDQKSRLEQIFETKLLADCTFVVGKENGQYVEGHKVILSMTSPVLHEKLKAAGGDHPKITITDIEPEVFQAMLKYIYTAAIDINADTVYDVAAAAETYQLPGLLKACLDHVIGSYLTPKNVLRAYNLALCTGENQLKKKCEEVIGTRTKEVLADSSFVEACLEVVEAVFLLENLDIDSELDLLTAADRYAKHLSSDHDGNTSIRNVLGKIRFLSLTSEEFAKALTTAAVLSTNDALAIFAHIAYDKSGVPMPPGFSLRRDGRKNVKLLTIETLSEEIRFEVVVPDIKRLFDKNEDAWSSTFLLQNLKWKLLFKDLTVIGDTYYLSIYPHCNWESTSNTWLCKADIEILLLRADKKEAFKQRFTHIYKQSEHKRGIAKFIKMYDLLNPNYHYIKNGAITLQFHIKADKPKL